jgi:serine/threonine protein kinase
MHRARGLLDGQWLDLDHARVSSANLPPMRAPVETLAGEELEFGKYKLIAFLDRGGTADVYLASMPGPAGFAKLVALKRMRAEYWGDAAAKRMFFAEARLAAMLAHPNIVQTIDVGEIDRAPYIVMEFLQGQPLHKILERAVEQNVPLGLAVPMRIISAVLEGLQYAHELRDIDGTVLGVVHHDISPHNIFVTYTGQIKLLDFGIAWISGLEPRTTELQGRPAYMAPEVAFGGQIDRRADLFSLGVVLWELFARRRMLKASGATETLEVLKAGNFPKLSTVARGVPERLDLALTRALSIDPNGRYATAADMRRELDEIVDTKSSRASEEDVAKVVNQLFNTEREYTKDRIRTRVLPLRQRIIIAGAVESAEQLGQEAEQRFRDSQAEIAQAAALAPPSKLLTNAARIAVFLAIAVLVAIGSLFALGVVRVR